MTKTFLQNGLRLKEAKNKKKKRLKDNNMYIKEAKR